MSRSTRRQEARISKHHKKTEPPYVGCYEYNGPPPRVYQYSQLLIHLITFR
jgi:hypothetical protein